MKRERIFGRGSTLSNTTSGRLTMLFLAGSAAFSFGGPLEPVLPPPPPEEPRDWCDFYKNIGKLYSNSDNPWVQEFNIVSRLQYQWGYVNGEAGDDDFEYSQDEFRRMYVGASAKFLRWLEVSGQANYFDDDHARGGDSRGPEFQHMWDMFVKFNAKAAFGLEGLDALKIGYGAREVHMAEEWNTSSKNIKTVERSAIANKIWPFDEEFSNPTGAWIEGEIDALAWHLGVFTTTQDDWIAPWNDGELYYLKLIYDFAEASGMSLGEVLFNVFYQDVNLDDERLAAGVEWAGSLGLRLGQDRWELHMNAIVGDNGDQSSPAQEGSFWGLVVLPSYWLIPERLEAVGRYQYEGSEEEQGVRIYSRYVRRADSDHDIGLPNSGRGDEHHSFYAGLNYYLCGNNAKFMAGLQYDDITAGGSDVFNGWTTFLAFRTFF